MMIRKKREKRESAIVALDGNGIKASTDKKLGITPLRSTLDDVVRLVDELLVLIILNSEAWAPSPKGAVCCLGDHRHSDPFEGDAYICFLHQEINQRKEAYRQILRPFYDKCKTTEVKFQAKIAAGFRPKDIILEEANNVKATWIIFDRCFARDRSFRLSRTDCKISFVSDDAEAVVHNYTPASETSVVREVKPNLTGIIETMPQEVPICYSSTTVKSEYQPSPSSLLPSASTESKDPTKIVPSDKAENLESAEQGTALHDNLFLGKYLGTNVALKRPFQLSWEAIAKITAGRAVSSWADQNEKFQTYYGFLAEHKSHVLVKRYTGDSSGILKAEKRVAMSMHHKNILRLSAYHKSEGITFLVFPFNATRGTLDKYISSLRGKQLQLTFQEKMKIALGIAQGVRYMHEECPRGLIVHGDLQPYNIFLRCDLQPLISGFGRARWLHLDQTSPNNRCSDKNSLDLESMTLVKADILAFGVLLLRLFCRRSVPQDDKSLIEWARPLLHQRAFHKLLDEETEDLDLYGIYKVMCAAVQCIMTRPILRPCMSEVISMLKGEKSCAVELSPSSDPST